MSNEEFSVVQGRTPKLTYTVQQDWCDLMPITHGAARLYRILRSMMVENGQAAAKPTRNFTMDRLCWLMSSFQSKPVGEQTIRDYRRELVDCQMIDIVPGRGRTDPPSYLVHDVPPDGWVGWRNGWHVDDAYSPDWRITRPEPEPLSASNGQFVPRPAGGSKDNTPKGDKHGHSHPRGAVPHGSPGGSHGSPGGSHGSPGFTSVLSSTDGASKEVFKEGLKKSSSSSSSSGASEQGPLRGPENEDEEDHDMKEKQLPKQRNRTIKSINDKQHRKILEALTGPRRVQLQGGDWQAATGHIGALCEGGWTQAQIESLFVHDDWGRIRMPHRHILKKLEGAVGSPSVPTVRESTEALLGALMARRELQKADIAACDGCSPMGRTSMSWHGHDEEGLSNRIWALENPAEAASIAEFNAMSHRKAKA